MATPDLRIENDEEITKSKEKLLAALLSANACAYACEFNGVSVTVLGYNRGPDGVVPLAIILDEEEWAKVPHLGQTHYAAKVRPVRNWNI